jgi:hypothetical protein
VDAHKSGLLNTLRRSEHADFVEVAMPILEGVFPYRLSVRRRTLFHIAVAQAYDTSVLRDCACSQPIAPWHHEARWTDPEEA